MRISRRVAITLTPLLVAACATPAPHQDQIEFVWGCWVQKDKPGGTIESFLRLLPSEDRSSYSGFLTEAQNRETTRHHFSFTRDGATAKLTAAIADRQSPDGYQDVSSLNLKRDPAITQPTDGFSHIAVYLVQPAPKLVFTPGLRMIVEATPDRLRMSQRADSPLPDETRFDGERDGCD